MKKFLTLSCLFLAIVNEVVAYPNGPYPGQSQSAGSTNPPGAFTNGQPVISAGVFIGDGSGLTNLNVTAVSILTNGGNSGDAFYSIDPGVWGTSSEAFGYDASAPGNFSFAAGEESAANGPASTVIGYSAAVFLHGTNGVTIGSHALVTGPNGVAIGAGAATDVGIAIGEGVTVLGPQVVLGNANITNTILQGVVNGNGAGLTNLSAGQLSSTNNNLLVNNNLTPVPQTFFGNLNGYWNGNTNGIFAFASVTNCLAGWWSWNGNLYNSIAQDNAFFVNINGYAAPAYVANGESLQAISPGVGGFRIVTTNNNAYDIGVFTNWTF
jgi:hypothetical protein